MNFNCAARLEGTEGSVEPKDTRYRHTHSYHHNKQVVDNVIVSCTPKAQEDNTKCLNNGGS